MRAAISQSFEEAGFLHIRDVFGNRSLLDFEDAILDVAKKITGSGVSRGIDPVDGLQDIEQRDPAAFYEICSQAGGTLAGLSLVTVPRLWAHLDALVPNARCLLPVHPVLFWNDRTVKRLQYDWHQESNYFPDIPRALHVWFPLFAGTTRENGPMLIAVGSHKERRPYTHTKSADGLTQLRTVGDVQSLYEIHECVCERGDAIIFHHNTIHCTGVNLTDRPRATGIIRMIDTMAAPKFTPMMGFVYRESITKAVEDGANG